MPVLVKGDRALLFVHIPKTGGSTIERHFKRCGWEVHLRSTRKSDPTLFPFLRSSPQHYTADVLRQVIRLDRVEGTFAVVRDPVSRFRSEFAMRHRSWRRAPAAEVHAWAEGMLGRCRRNPHLLDNHLRPQVDFLLPGCAVHRLEDGLEAVVADLNERFGLDLPLAVPHALQSARRGLPSSSVELSERTIDLLREFYREDFARLGYSV